MSDIASLESGSNADFLNKTGSFFHTQAYAVIL